MAYAVNFITSVRSCAHKTFRRRSSTSLQLSTPFCVPCKAGATLGMCPRCGAAVPDRVLHDLPTRDM